MNGRHPAAEEILTLIRNRRSVRQFSSRAVPTEIIDQIVECGLSAPSSKNSNPWFFVLASGPEKTAIVEWLCDASQSPAGMTERAPIDPRTGETRPDVTDTVDESIATIRQCDSLILLFNRGPFSGGAAGIAELADRPHRSSTFGKALYGYAGEIVGIGAAAANMLLASQALGLGAVYIADSFPARQKIAVALKTTKELVGVIALGYPAEDFPPRALRHDLTASWSDAVGVMDQQLPETGHRTEPHDRAVVGDDLAATGSERGTSC